MSGLGDETHEEIVSLVRFDAMNMLRARYGDVYEDIYCMAAEQLMATALGISPPPGRSKAGRVPDVVLGCIGYSDDGTWLVVEVGRYDPAKWEPDVPVLHIGFNGNVNLINSKGHPFERQVADVVKEVLARQI